MIDTMYQSLKKSGLPQDAQNRVGRGWRHRISVAGQGRQTQGGAAQRCCASEIKMKSAEKAVISIVCRLGKEYRRDDQNAVCVPRQEMPDLKKEPYNE